MQELCHPFIRTSGLLRQAWGTPSGLSQKLERLWWTLLVPILNPSSHPHPHPTPLPPASSTDPGFVLVPEDESRLC